MMERITDDRKRKGGKSGNGNGFQVLGLSEPVYRGIVRMGFRTPTPVQRKSLPVILTGSDTCVMARTGSGKTAAFVIPVLEKLAGDASRDDDDFSQQHQQRGCRAVILSPTRELSLQTLRVLEKLAHFTSIKAVGIHGGESMEKQFDLLSSKPHVIVATPGRLAHHLTEIPDFNLRHCCMFVLDEADRLLEMGFALQIRQIAASISDEMCQKVLLSATMPKALVEFTKGGFCVDPQVVRLDQEASVSDELRIAFCTCKSHDKDAALLHLMNFIQQDQEEQHESQRTGLTLVFAATRHHVEYITCLLKGAGIKATLVYGTLDQEARKANLAAFRSGRNPVLVVTDVAARGIDVPLIDHVIHYAFPPSAKLFIHRSGRAARAGRIGYCWALVEPDEMPYMVDLHLFLGRKLSTGSDMDGEEESETKGDFMYTLDEMTPDMVHYGTVPESVLVHEIENVRRIMDSELTGSNEAETLKALAKVCNNAMKQYRRTRPEASRAGVRRAKAILEGERLESGKRVGGGAFIPTHPLLLGMERREYLARKETDEKGGLDGLENLQKRQEFLRAMANFRPKETVFEAFSTAGGKNVGVVSHVDKGRTTNSKKNDTSAAALMAMKSMRRQMRIANDKGSALVIAGSVNAQTMNGDAEQAPPDTAESEVRKAVKPEPKLQEEPIMESKRRLSKAERKRLKKDPKTTVEQVVAESSDAANKGTNTKKDRRDFRDEAFFISNNYSAREREVEAAMQPSASSTQKGSTATALRIEETMLDIVGDENADLVQKQRMMRWDKSKRKYVQTTIGAELSGDSKSKKIRLESGQLVSRDKMKLGEVYEKWQKKTNKSIGRVGVFDDAVQEDVAEESVVPQNRLGGKQKQQGKQKRAKGEDFKSATQIRKERESKQNLKMKNMKKSERRRVEQRNSENNAPMGPPKKGKKGVSGRWKKR